MAPSEERRRDPDLLLPEIFCSYALEDETLFQQLEQRLLPLQHTGRLVLRHQGQITAGKKSREVIQAWEAHASMILLLVSPAFLVSETCVQETRQAIQQCDTHVLPVILRPCSWSTAPFAELQCLPRDEQAITLWENQDQAWQEVIKGILQALDEQSSPDTSTPLRSLPNPRAIEKKEETPHYPRDSRQTLVPPSLAKTEQRSEDKEEVLFKERKAALIVGVNKTQYPSLLPDLKYAEANAHDVAYILRTPACKSLWHQTALIGEKAEMQAVRRA